MLWTVCAYGICHLHIPESYLILSYSFLVTYVVKLINLFIISMLYSNL